MIATGPDAVKVAFEKWAAAPMHIKAMAGAYVGPLLEAMAALSQDQQLILDKTALLSAELERWKAERAASLAHLIQMIEEGEAMGVPEWVIKKMKSAVEVTNGA